MRYLLLALLAGCSSNTGWYDITTGQPTQGRPAPEYAYEIEVTGTVPREALQKRR